MVRWSADSVRLVISGGSNGSVVFVNVGEPETTSRVVVGKIHELAWLNKNEILAESDDVDILLEVSEEGSEA